MKLRALLFLMLISTAGCLSDCGKDNLLTGPSSISGSSGGGPELWIAPNNGSRDFVRMFTNLEEWPSARAAISTVQFYEQNVSSGSCPMCGENTLDNFLRVNAFHTLGEQGKNIALEAGALKDGAHGCEASIGPLSGNAINAIRNVGSGGGKVSYLSMDWPFASGTICGYTIERSAELVAEFVRTVESATGVRVGLIQGYPWDTFGRFQKIIEALEKNGVHLPYVHYDYDRYGTQRPGPDPENKGGYNVNKELPQIRDYLKKMGITFGVVVFGEDGDSTPGYAGDSVLSVTQVRAALSGRVDRLIFQSWEPVGIPGTPSWDVSKRLFPDNLPEKTAGTLTYIVNKEGRTFR